MKIPQKFKNAIDIAIKEMKEELNSWPHREDLIGISSLVKRRNGYYLVMLQGYQINEEDEEEYTIFLAREIPA